MFLKKNILNQKMGFTIVLTLSGVTKEDYLDHYGYSPDFIINSIKDLLDEEFFTQVLEKVSEPSYMFDKKLEEIQPVYEADYE